MNRKVHRDHIQVLYALDDLKMEVKKRRCEKMIWGPENRPPGRKHGFSGIDFKDLLLNVFEKFFFSIFNHQCASNPGVSWP